jgi:transposase
MGCGSGTTCWRQLHAWQQAGIWEHLHRVLLDRLGSANAIHWGSRHGSDQIVRFVRTDRERGAEAPPPFP